MKQPYVRAKDLGLKLDAARRKRGWTIAETAQKAKVDSGQVSRFLSHDFTRLSPRLSAVCQVLGVDPVPFTNGNGSSSNEVLITRFRQLISEQPKKQKAINTILSGIKGLLEDKLK